MFFKKKILPILIVFFISLCVFYLPNAFARIEKPPATIDFVSDSPTYDDYKPIFQVENQTDYSTKDNGRIWTDFSSMTNSGSPVTVKVNSDSITSTGEVLNRFSAFASTQSGATQILPDVVMVIETSYSQCVPGKNFDESVNYVFQKTKEVSGGQGRFGVILENGNNPNPYVVLPLDVYSDVNAKITGTYTMGITATRASDNQQVDISGSGSSCWIQELMNAGYNMLLETENVKGHIPMMFLMTDCAADGAQTNPWWDGGSAGGSRLSINHSSGTYQPGILITVMNCAYKKKVVEKHYNTKMYNYSMHTYHGSYTPPQIEFVPEPIIMDPVKYLDQYPDYKTNFEKYLADEEIPGVGKVLDHPTDLDITYEDLKYVDEYFYVSTPDVIKDTFDVVVGSIPTEPYDCFDISDSSHSETVKFVQYAGSYMDITDVNTAVIFGKKYNVSKMVPETTEEDSILAKAGISEDPSSTYTFYQLDSPDTTLANPVYENETFKLSDIIIVISDKTPDDSQDQASSPSEQITIIVPVAAIAPRLDDIQTDDTATTLDSNISDPQTYPLSIFYSESLSKDIKLDKTTIDIDKISDSYKAANSTKKELGTEVSFYASYYAGSSDINKTYSEYGISSVNPYYYTMTFMPIYDDSSTAGIVGQNGKRGTAIANIDDISASKTYYVECTYYRPSGSSSSNDNKIHWGSAEEVSELIAVSGSVLSPDILGYYNTDTNQEAASAGNNVVVAVTPANANEPNRNSVKTNTKKSNSTSTDSFASDTVFSKTATNTIAKTTYGNNSKLIAFAPDPQPDLEITKTADKTFAQIGDTITYTIAVSNPTVDPAFDTVITDEIPTELIFVESDIVVSPDGIGTPIVDGHKISLSLASVEPGQNIMITIPTTVGARPGENAEENVTSEENRGEGDSPSEENPEGGTPESEIQGNGVPIGGTPIEEASIEGIRIENQMLDTTSTQIYAGGDEQQLDQEQQKDSKGTEENNGNENGSVNEPSAVEAFITNTVTVEANSIQPISASAQVQFLVPVVDFSKTASAETANPGDELIYTLSVMETVENARAENIIITDELPEGVLLSGDVSCSANDANINITNEENVITIEIPELVYSQEATTFEIPVIIEDETYGQEITNTAILNGTNLESVSGVASITINNEVIPDPVPEPDPEPEPMPEPESEPVPEPQPTLEEPQPVSVPQKVLAKTAEDITIIAGICGITAIASVILLLVRRKK